MIEYGREVWQDVRYAVRSMRQAPGFAAVAVLTLALGIGANSTIFSVVHGVLLESLPFRDAHELVQIRTAYPNGENYSLSAPDFMSIHDDNRAFSGVAAYSGGSQTVLGLGEPKEITGAFVSKGYFELLGAGLRHGRFFAEDEHTPGRNTVLIVSDGFWRQELGGAPDVTGRSLTLGGVPHTIVGVLAADAQLPAEGRLFAPLAYDSTFSAVTIAGRRGEFLSVIGRLRPGQTVESALREVQDIGAKLQKQFPETNETLTFTARSLTDALLGDVRTPLLVLLGAVAFVLLVACANVANLLIARATAREGEIAVRAALGAGRGRLIRQLLTESLVLATLGAGLGLLLAWLGTNALVQARPVELPRLEQAGVDRTVILFTIGVSLVTAVLFGAMPALQATGVRLSNALRTGGRGGLAGARSTRVRSALIIAELALAVILLVGAGLLIRSFLQLTRVEPGFEPDRAVSLRVALQGPRYDDPAARIRFFETLFTRIGALPGVTHVGGSTTLPLSGGAAMFSFEVEGAPPPPAGIFPEIRAVTVTPDYFRSIGGTLLRGRMLNEQDRSDAPQVVLVNRAAIARWFPDGDPVGERVVIGPVREVVGVVDDVLQTTPGEAAEPEVYIPYSQRPVRTLRVVVRATGDVIALGPRIRQEIHALDPDLALDAVAPLRDVVSASVARPRFYTTLLALFAIAALSLAVVGIFGLMSYTVAQRSRELGVRMALGADAGSLVRMVVQNALALAITGLAIGVVGALVLGRVLENQLFGVSATDPVTLAAVVAILLSSAVLASYIPARKVAAIQPGRVLR